MNTQINAWLETTKVVKRMKKLITVLLAAMLFIANSAYAGALEDADKAYASKNYTQALKLYKPLALKGEASAQYNLGVMYNNGQGVIQDYAEAVKWYKLAAVQGDAYAQSNLGFMYERGRGVIQDYTEALKYYMLATMQGNATAFNNLGVMFEAGNGVTQDYVIAHMWYNLAAAKLADKAEENRDLLAKKMTPIQIAEAQKLAKQCLANNYKNCLPLASPPKQKSNSKKLTM